MDQQNQPRHRRDVPADTASTAACRRLTRSACATFWDGLPCPRHTPGAHALPIMAATR